MTGCAVGAQILPQIGLLNRLNCIFTDREPVCYYIKM